MHSGREGLPYREEMIRSRAKFLEAVYFPNGKTPEEVMGKYHYLSHIIKDTVNKVQSDASKWPTLVAFTDYLVGSTTPARQAAIKARFGFDDGKPKNWREVGDITCITRFAAYERVNQAIKNFRAYDLVRIVKIFNWQKEVSR